MILVI